MKCPNAQETKRIGCDSSNHINEPLSIMSSLPAHNTVSARPRNGKKEHNCCTYRLLLDVLPSPRCSYAPYGSRKCVHLEVIVTTVNVQQTKVLTQTLPINTPYIDESVAQSQRDKGEMDNGNSLANVRRGLSYPTFYEPLERRKSQSQPISRHPVVPSIAPITAPVDSIASSTELTASTSARCEEPEEHHQERLS